MRRIEAKVALCGCVKYHKVFGIRFEKTAPNTWAPTWAFKIKKDTARREGYDNNMISGNLGYVDGYPGCPYCGDESLILCTCGRLNCSTYGLKDGDYATCEWCGETHQIQVTNEDWDIKSNSDR